MYSAQVLDHFEHPRNAGELIDPDGAAQVENPACGDILELTLRVEEGRIAEIRFRAKGCVPAMACGSLITEMVHAKPVGAAAALTAKDLVASIGGLPAASGHAGELAVETLRKALADVKG